MQKTDKILESTISQAAKILYGNILAGIPTLFLGSPGTGKTTIVRQVHKAVVEKLGLLFGGCFVLPTREYNTIDLGGLYKVDETTGLTKRCAADIVPYDKPILILIDELGDAPSFEQSGWYKLILEQTIGNKKLFQGSYVCAASNRIEDEAAANELSSALLKRVCCVTVKADYLSLVAYAKKQGWDSRIVTYLKTFGEKDIDNGFDTSLPYCGSTPRDFERLNSLEQGGFISSDPEIALRQIVGNIDHRAGREYFAFRQLPIPSPDLVFSSPATAPTFNDNIGQQALYCAAIVGACETSNKAFLAVVEYAKRLNRVIGLSLCFDLSASQPTFVDSTAWKQAALTFHELLA